MTLKNGSSFIKPFGRILINHTAEIPGKLYTTLAFFPPVPGELIIRQAQGQARRSNVTEKFAKGGAFTALPIHIKASMEMIFSPRSTSPMYLGFRSTISARCSCVSPDFFRRIRMASPMSLRCLSGEITALLETLPRVLDDLSPDGRTYCPVNGLWQTHGRTHRERGRHGHAGEFLLTILLTVGLFLPVFDNFEAPFSEAVVVRQRLAKLAPGAGLGSGND